jgi:hypothetical protein
MWRGVEVKITTAGGGSYLQQKIATGKRGTITGRLKFSASRSRSGP